MKTGDIHVGEKTLFILNEEIAKNREEIDKLKKAAKPKAKKKKK